MEFKDIIETIEFELVLEGIGTILGFQLLWQFFFHNNLHTLLTLFITTIC